MGRQVKIGYVAPLTGPLAAMAVPDKYCVEHFEKVIGDGLVLGDGKKHPIRFWSKMASPTPTGRVKWPET